jgi:hypothetical protein
MAETLRKKVDEPIVSPAGLIHGYDNLARYIGLPAISVKKAKGFGIPRIPDFSYGTAFRKADVDSWLEQRAKESAAGESESPVGAGTGEA